MTRCQITVVEPSADSEIAATYVKPDYRDAFLVPAQGWATVEQFASAYFLNQPRWLSMVSMNLTSRAKLVAALADSGFAQGSAVGAWQVHRRSDNEIVFGDDMGFMEYRFSMRLLASGDIEASTAVKYRWQRMSHLYFSIVKPMHRRFVPMSLRAAISPEQAAALITNSARPTSEP